MKSYLVLLIRVGMLNFIAVFVIVMYYSYVSPQSFAKKTVSTAVVNPVASAQSSSDQFVRELVSPTPAFIVLPDPLEDIPSPAVTPRPIGLSATPTPKGQVTVPTATPQKTAAPTQAPIVTSPPVSQPTSAPTQAPTPVPTQAPPSLVDEAAPHNTPDDCWLVINNHIYNITNYFGLHPGGDEIMAPYCGKDATQAYATQDKNPAVAHSAQSNAILGRFIVK